MIPLPVFYMDKIEVAVKMQIMIVKRWRFTPRFLMRFKVFQRERVIYSIPTPISSGVVGVFVYEIGGTDE